MKTEQHTILSILSHTLSGGAAPADLPEEIKKEARQQAIYPLIAADKLSLKIIAKNLRLAWEQQQLSEVLNQAGIPFVVLKGLAAAIYYPKPLNRTLGDIDIIVAPEEFAAAYDAMKAGGYATADPVDGGDRHVHFKMDGVSIELHRRYASLNTRKAEEILDSWIYEAIPRAVTGTVESFAFPMLPEPLNGLTLLAHISQHLEGGLGIRQIIDWVMYVKSELPDEKWPAFREKTDLLGLTTLAKVTARLGQLYLGLSEKNISWCTDIDESICRELLDYIFKCGNFGKKAGTNNTVAMVLSHGKGAGGVFRNLQNRGESNWEALKTHPELKPFAWLYQAGRYAAKGFRRDHALSELRKDIGASKRRNALMEALGATQLAKRQADSHPDKNA